MLQAQDLYGNRRAQIDNDVVSLGRNLFACLPEDAFDRGPLAQGGFRFVADARLDNRPDLISALGLASSDHLRMCDAALLFRALLKWGDDAVDRLVGEFAFALWDGAKQHWLLGRDFFGLRPLYFHQGSDFFAFASMPSGLHALERVPYDLDEQFMVEQLAGLPQVDRRTYFKDIERVQPGHIVRISATGVEGHRFWDPPGFSASRNRHEDFEEGLRSVFEEAVRSQLRGAGNTVATQLSSGLDSSTVTSTLARLLPQGRVVAYTAAPRAGFDGLPPPGTIANESEIAAATARLYPNIEHVVVENSGESPLRWLDRNFLYRQQPMPVLANAVWGQAIHQAAQSIGSKVIFKGALGNLSISYSGEELLPLLLSQGRVPTLIRHLLLLARNGVPLRSLGATTLGPWIPAPMWTALRRMLGGAPLDRRSYSAVNWAYAADVKRVSKGRGDDLAGRPSRNPDDLRRWVFRDVDGGNAYKSVLAEWGLSVRDPTADKRVIEYCLTVPPDEFVRGGMPRSLARRAFSDRLPTEVTASRVRGYQSADWYEALGRARGQIEQELSVIERCPGADQALDLDGLKESVSSWPTSGWNRGDVINRYRGALLQGLAAGHFMRRVRGTN